MRGSCLLCDTDVVADLHTLGYWNGVSTYYGVHVSSTVIDEADYYEDLNREQVPLDIRLYIKNNEVIEVSASVAETAVISQKLARPGLPGLHDGELECIAIIAANKIPDLTFCVIDKAAIMTISYLGLEGQTISFEEMLVSGGIIRRSLKLDYKYTNKRFRKFVTEGKLLAISHSETPASAPTPPTSGELL